jgi:hypothetical protein
MARNNANGWPFGQPFQQKSAQSLIAKGENRISERIVLKQTETAVTRRR